MAFWWRGSNHCNHWGIVIFHMDIAYYCISHIQHICLSMFAFLLMQLGIITHLVTGALSLSKQYSWTQLCGASFLDHTLSQPTPGTLDPFGSKLVDEIGHGGFRVKNLRDLYDFLDVMPEAEFRHIDDIGALDISQLMTITIDISGFRGLSLSLSLFMAIPQIQLRLKATSGRVWSIPFFSAVARNDPNPTSSCPSRFT